MSRQKRKFLGLITRCKDEYFVKEFCNYYLREGVDRIFIIDDNSNDPSIYNGIDDESVEIIYEKDIITRNYANKFYRKIRRQYEWMIYVDVDEYITSKKTPENSIRQELLSTFKEFDCIKIPWVMMSCNGVEQSPKSVLRTNVYRWDHDRRHPNPIHKFRCRYEQIEVKCIFKTKAFSRILDHHPKNPRWMSIFRKPKVVDSVQARPSELNAFYPNLRENDIKGAYMVCYHYRIISVENCKNKLFNNLWYIKSEYSLDDLLSSDHPERKDMTLRNKMS